MGDYRIQEGEAPMPFLVSTSANALPSLPAIIHFASWQIEVGQYQGRSWQR
jgi:hypothetical protein